ncbi:sigma-70 family RNA polymerase sigma factor [Kiloniella sp. b19]|uniref:sigma-70 family RNA polymerase sigma factor n=1 Tax=Kiloniella sp. GXU_MW_B19 TaxID=3141326 RepID=UPI0031E27FBD
MLLDDAIVERLYILYDVPLRKFLGRMLRNEETAAEIAQESYTRILRYSSGRPVEDPKAYLFRTAANLAKDYLAKEKTRNLLDSPEDTLEQLPSSLPSAETLTENRQRLELIAKSVEELPARQKEVFLLSRAKGLSNGQIAEQLCISRNMVEKHIIKAMIHCRNRLKEAEK